MNSHAPDYVTEYLSREWSIRQVPQEFQSVENAGRNPIPESATPYQRGMILRLDVYEREFMKQYSKNPDCHESAADHLARFASGLTQDGLVAARGYAGKKATSVPGVLFPKSKQGS